MQKNRRLDAFLRGRAKSSKHYKSKVLNTLMSPKNPKVQNKKEK